MLGFLLVLLLAPAIAVAQPKILWNTPFGGSTTLWSPNGDRLASIGDGGITVVDVASAQRISDIIAYPYQPSFDADGSHIIMVTEVPGAIMSFDVQTGALVRSAVFQDTTIKSLVFSRDRGRGIAWYSNNVVVVFDTETLDTIMSVKFLELKHVAISGDGMRFACTIGGAATKNVVVYAVETSSPIVTVGSEELMATLNTSGDTVVTAASNGLLTSWDVGQGSKIAQSYWSLYAQGSITSLMFDPNDAHIVVVADQTAVFDVAGVEYQGKINQKSEQPIQFSADGELMMSFKRSEGTVLYSMTSHRIENTVAAYQDSSVHASLAPGGSVIAYVLSDNTVRSYDLAVSMSSVLLEHTAPYHLATRPNQHCMVVNDGRVVRTFDITSGAELGHIELSRFHQVVNVTDTEVWTLREDTLLILSLPNGSLVRTQVFPTEFHNMPICFPDSTHILGLFTDGTMRKVNVRTGEESWSVPREQGQSITTYYCSPSGSRFAVRSGSSSVFVYHAENGSLINTFTVPGTATIFSVILHPDDRRLIAGTGSGDNALRIWDIDSGDSLHTLRSHKGIVQYPTLYRDGVRTVTTSTDSTVCLWDIDQGILLDKATLTASPRGTLIDPQGEIMVITTLANSTTYEMQLLNAASLDKITTLSGWYSHAFDASGSRIVVGRSGAVGVADILPYVITLVSDGDHVTTSVAPDLTLTPNPISGSSILTVRFTSTDHQSIQICDVTGQILRTFHGTGTLERQHIEIDGAGLPRGVLFLRAIDSSLVSTTLMILAD